MQIEERKELLDKLIQNHKSGNTFLYAPNINRSILIDILVEHGDKDMILFYMDELFGFDLEGVVQYCIKYSKTDILDNIISKYCTDNDPKGIKYNIKQWMCMYAYQYNNKEYLTMSKETRLSALYGACVGNHPSLVKEILMNADPFIQGTIDVCAKLTKSLEIIQMLYPNNYVSSNIFTHVLQCEMYDVVDWIIDNNLEIQDDYTSARTHDYLYKVYSLEFKPILYLILHKKIKITQRHMYCNLKNLELLVFIHLSDYKYSRKCMMLEDYLEQFLSMYPNCDKTKFKSLSMYSNNYNAWNYVNGDEYIDQYLIKRGMLHEEMKLLYDLPNDLCKQII
jgi:hypothetical protein